jgi:nicotinamide phosphoribosyltransferase
VVIGLGRKEPMELKNVLIKMERNNMDWLTTTDSYKTSHYLQFAPEAKYTHYYIESRGGADKVLFFGLQMILKKFFLDTPRSQDIGQAVSFWSSHGLPFNREGWAAICELGYLPLKIVATPEGSVVSVGTPLVTIENTDPRFGWLPGWVETILLQLWYPTTVATRSWECKQIIKGFLETSGDVEGLPFKLHDFGFRGVSSYESASLGGAGHLVNFMGTDNVAGIHAGREYYNTSDMLGFSIPAAEHSTITSWGKGRELEAYKNMLSKFAREGSLVAVVSDSYDYWKALKEWGTTLKQQVISSGATLVIRPDSGDPIETTLKSVRTLNKYYGSGFNEQGYRVLNHVRVICGDGINNPEIIKDLYRALLDSGYSADNVALGMGGGLLQQVNRDTYKFAMKLSAVSSDGSRWAGVNKSPVDAIWKASKKGRQEVNRGLVVFEDGVLYNESTFEQVRERSDEEV